MIYNSFGGSLSADDLTYVERKQDKELLEKLLEGEYCYVFNAHQMGKSSLRVRVIDRLKHELSSQGCQCISIDMSMLSDFSIPKKSWYDGFLRELWDKCDLENNSNFQDWIASNQNCNNRQRWKRFIEEILFINFPTQKIYIFLDEIDILGKCDFKDEILSFIRSCYEYRSEDKISDYYRLIFVFFGAVNPGDLIRDIKQPSFNIGCGIELTELCFEDAKERLIKGLEGRFDEPEEILKKVFAWSGGQPFLTQKICQLIVNYAETNQPDVDSLIEKNLIKNWEVQDHIKYIRDYLLSDIKLLRLYQKILKQGNVKFDDSKVQVSLKLSGVVLKKEDKLVVFNRIYREVFNRDWVNEQLANLNIMIYNSNIMIYNSFGGSLSADDLTYVERKQDKELLEKLLEGEYCYVFNARQMGKSSLRVRVIDRLKHELSSQGCQCISINMSILSDFSIPKKSWYDGFLRELWDKCDLENNSNFQDWIASNQNCNNRQRWKRFIEEILFINFPTQKIYIFLDEIDILGKCDFKDEILSFIRSCYEYRSEDENSDYYRLIFGFFGAVNPGNLIRDIKQISFNIGCGIELNELRFEDAKERLIKGLEGRFDEPEEILKKVFAWSGGQPFLTQKICQLIVNYAETNQPDVNSLIEKHLIKNWEDQDNPIHLKHIRDYLLSDIKLLRLYQKILKQGNVKFDDSKVQMSLKLSGVVLKKEDKLVVFNRIYREVFNRDWVKEQLANLRNQGQKTWPPNFKQVAALVFFLVISWQLSVQKFLLDRRVLVQAIYRQYTRQNLANNIPPVLLVQIDDESIIKAKIAEPNPMRRDYLASLVKRVSKLETRVIGIDYLLDRSHKRRDGGVGERLLVEAIQTAVKKQQWIVFVQKNQHGAIPEIASLNWSLQGNMTVLGRGRYLALPNFSNLKNMTFSSMLLLAYQLNYDKISDNLPQPNLENKVNFLVQLYDYIKQEKEAINYEKFFSGIYLWKSLTLFSYRLKQWWLHPIIDFSISYDQVYDCIPAWRLLKSNNSLISQKTRRCEVTQIEDKVKQQVVIIAAGGYDNAGLKYGGDNYIPPMAFRYWNNDKNLTGGEIHAYMLHHFLTNRIVIPIPDFWMTWVGGFLGQGIIILLHKYPGKRGGWVMVFVVANFVYVIVSLQVYISVAVLLPIVSPSVAFWVYFWLNKRRIKDEHN